MKPPASAALPTAGPFLAIIRPVRGVWPSRSPAGGAGSRVGRRWEVHGVHDRLPGESRRAPARANKHALSAREAGATRGAALRPRRRRSRTAPRSAVQECMTPLFIEWHMDIDWTVQWCERCVVSRDTCVKLPQWLLRHIAARVCFAFFLSASSTPPSSVIFGHRKHSVRAVSLYSFLRLLYKGRDQTTTLQHDYTMHSKAWCAGPTSHLEHPFDINNWN